MFRNQNKAQIVFGQTAKGRIRIFVTMLAKVLSLWPSWYEIIDNKREKAA